MALRFDRGTLRKPERLSDGSLRVDAVITRAGVFEYRKPDGSISKEYRPREEVSKKASLDSAIGKAATDDHPWHEPDGLINIENRERLQRGFVLADVRMDGDEVVAAIVVTSPELIAKLESGHTCVSCGYEQDLVSKSGTTPNGERYDSIQTNIQYNHVALAVDVPRAGDVARVRMDSAVMIAGDTGKGDTVMEELKKALADLAAQMVKNGELQARLDAVTAEKTKLETSAKETQSRLDAVTAERDAAKEKAEKAEKARLDGEATRMDAARARIKLEETAARFVRNDAGEPEPMTGKSDHEIRVALVEKLTGKTMAGKSEAYVQARLDAAIESDAAGEDALAAANNAANNPSARNDSGMSAVEKARAEHYKREQNRHENIGKKGA
jgi:hypothetical protein